MEVAETLRDIGKLEKEVSVGKIRLKGDPQVELSFPPGAS